MFELLLAAGATAAFASCEQAVNELAVQGPGVVASACADDGRQINILEHSGLPEICLRAMRSGREAEKAAAAGNLLVRDALIKDFNQRAQACKSAPPPVPPTLNQVQIWD